MGTENVRTFRVGSSVYRANPEAGARLIDWTIGMAQAHERSVIHWPADADAGTPGAAIAQVRGGNPILFPFAGRSFYRGIEGRWKIKGHDPLPMPKHGIARQGRFALEELRENGFSAVLVPDTAAHEAYPFKYMFRVAYHFDELAFTVRLELENRDGEPLPWAPGHHFYFTLPWTAGSTRADYRIHLDAGRAYYHSPEGALVREPGRDRVDDFADPRLSDRIHTHLKTHVVSFGPRSGEQDIHIRIGDGGRPSPWTALVTWAEKPDSPYYCVEPWTAPPNAAEHGKGLRHVNPGESDVFSVEVSLL